jgi:hypothetical protein
MVAEQRPRSDGKQRRQAFAPPRQIDVPDRVNTVMDPTQSSRIDHRLDARARISEQLLKLADGYDAMLSSDQRPKLPPPLRSTCVN